MSKPTQEVNPRVQALPTCLQSHRANRLLPTRNQGTAPVRLQLCSFTGDAVKKLATGSPTQKKALCP